MVSKGEDRISRRKKVQLGLDGKPWAKQRREGSFLWATLKLPLENDVCLWPHHDLLLPGFDLIFLASTHEVGCRPPANSTLIF